MRPDEIGNALESYRRNLTPREAWTPSEWAEQAPRIIPDNGINPEPGPMRFDRTPYLRELVDTLVEPGVEMVVFPKCTQIGYTTCIEMLPGYWADMDPGACMVVGPDQTMTEQILSQRILPTIQATPSLSEHLTGKPRDLKKAWIELDTMPIIGAWATSPARVASWPIRYLLCDEIDKFPRFSDREGDPILLADKRTSNWLHRARRLLGSTPTVREGNVWRWFESCGDRRSYWVPCPHCGEYQVLVWAQVKWPKHEGMERTEKADQIKNDQSAYYECKECRGSIHDHHKPSMLESGVWASQGQTVDHGGSLVGIRPRSKRVGFHLNSLYSPWLSMSDLAAEFITCVGDPAKMMDFRNSRLALPFEEQVSKPKPELIQSKLDEANGQGWEPLKVPAWAGCLLMTVDTQKDHFWVCVRAWGRGYRSRCIFWKRMESFDEVYSVLNSRFDVERPEGSATATMTPLFCMIDSGGTTDEATGVSRTHEVYQFSLRDPRIMPIKGASKPQSRPIRDSPQNPKAQPGHDPLPEITLRMLNVDWFKDLLMSRMQAKDGDHDLWQLTSVCDNDDYSNGMVAEHKIWDRNKNRHTWVPISAGAANHAWDVEVYQMAAADYANVGLMPDEKALEAERTKRARATSGQASQGAERGDAGRGRASSTWATRNRGKY